MKDNSKAVASMLLKDTILLIAFLVAALGMNFFVLFEALSVTESTVIKGVLIAVFAVTMLVMAGSMTWVTLHLRKNKDEVYGEDLYYQDLIRQQKEGR